jgi:hypothetical protein
MPRQADSYADRELTAELAARDLVGSTTRYERWRHAGLLPSHDRRGAGRGRGSTSVFDLETVEIAAALAHHTAQGRDLRISVIAWFLEAEVKGIGFPEPPGPAVASALAWAARTALPYRRQQFIRVAVIAAQKEQPRTIEPGQAPGMSSPTASLDLTAVREALLKRGSHRPDLSHLCVAEPSAEVFAKEFADLLAGAGVFPFLTSEQWRYAISDAQQARPHVGSFAALARHNPAIVLKNAEIQELRHARHAALGLAYYGDTLNRPSLIRNPQKRIEWRAYLDKLGVGPSLKYLARLIILPRDAAIVIAACLDPVYSSLEELLNEQYKQIVGIRYSAAPRPAGDEHEPLAYLTVWPPAARDDRQPPRVTARQIGIGNYYRKRLRAHAD